MSLSPPLLPQIQIFLVAICKDLQLGNSQVTNNASAPPRLHAVTGSSSSVHSQSRSVALFSQTQQRFQRISKAKRVSMFVLFSSRTISHHCKSQSSLLQLWSHPSSVLPQTFPSSINTKTTLLHVFHSLNLCFCVFLKWHYWVGFFLILNTFYTLPIQFLTFTTARCLLQTIHHSSCATSFLATNNPSAEVIVSTLVLLYNLLQLIFCLSDRIRHLPALK